MIYHVQGSGVRTDRIAGSLLEEHIVELPEDYPQFIRKVREKTGLTQEKFAAKLGVTFPTVNRWENGKTKPSPLAIARLEELIHSLGEDDTAVTKLPSQ